MRLGIDRRPESVRVVQLGSRDLSDQSISSFHFVQGTEAWMRLRCRLSQEQSDCLKRARVVRPQWNRPGIPRQAPQVASCYFQVRRLSDVKKPNKENRQHTTTRHLPLVPQISSDKLQQYAESTPAS